MALRQQELWNQLRDAEATSPRPTQRGSVVGRWVSRFVMPWILKAHFVLAKTRRGRKLVLAAGLGLVDLAQSEQARNLYAKARAKVSDAVVRHAPNRA